MTQKINISEMIKEYKPIWEQFILDLGYSAAAAKKFANGYEKAVLKLPLLEKLIAIEQSHDDCMKAGLKAANINEKNAAKRHAKG
jgi:hypothetical protein